MKKNREFMKAFDWGIELDTKSDQQKGVEMPDLFKSYDGYDLLELPAIESIKLEEKSFTSIIRDRKSVV